MVVKDRIALGTIAGIVATFPQLIFNFISVQLGFAKFYDYQVSSSVYLEKQLTYTIGGFFFGMMTWETVGAGMGIVTVYLIQSTGRAHWWLKGVLVSCLLMYTLVYGFFYALRAPNIVPWDLGTNWSIFIENIIFGVISGYLVVRWGDWKKARG